MQNRKRLLLILALPAALVAAVAGVALLLPAERIAALAQSQAEAALGREVRIERVSLKLFPTPGVSMTGVVIGGPVPDAPPLATVRRVVLRPRLLPLLRRQAVVDAVVLDGPRLLISIDSAGNSNLPTFSSDSAADPAANETGSGADIAFLVQRLQIQDGRIAFRDDRTGTAVRLDGYDQRLRLAGALVDGELRRIELEGELEIGDFGAVLPEQLAVPVEGVRIRVEHQALLDRAADSLELGRLAVRVQELGLEGSGTVRGVTAETREVALRLAAESFDVGELIRSLPRALFERGGKDGAAPELPDVSGRARMQVVVDGRLGGDAVPEVAGTIGIEQLGLAYGGMGELVSALDGEIAFSLDSVATTGLTGKLFGEPLRLSFHVRDLAAPVARASVRTAVDLDRIARAQLLPDSIEAAGRVALDLEVRAPVLEAARGTVDGTVEFQGVRVETPALEVPAVVDAGKLVFEGQRVQTKALGVRLGESDVAIDLDARNWLPFALGDTNALPRVALDARSKLLDADAILGAPDTLGYSQLLFARMAERPVNGRPVEEVAEEVGFGLPPLPPMELQGRYRAATMRMNGLEMKDVDVSVAGNGERLELTDARLNVMGGGVQVAARIGMAVARPGEETPAQGYPAVFSFQVQDVGAGPFFDTFTPFRDHLSGSLLLAGTARAVLDKYLLPLRESVVAEGSVAVGNGQLVNWPVLKGLGDQLGLAQFDTLTFKDWAGTFHIAGPRIAFEETAIESGDLHARAAGSLDFSGVLDFAATVELSPELTSKLRGEAASRLTAAAAGPDGRVPVGVRITGPATKPDIKLDFSAAAANAMAEARREAESKARAAAEEAAQKAAAKLVPGADSLSIPAIADTARSRLDNELRKRLCRFTKC